MNEETVAPESVEAPVEPTGSYHTELFSDTFRIGATLQLFIEKLQKARMVDQQWVAIAKTHFQEGVSATRRAVMKNDRF